MSHTCLCLHSQSIHFFSHTHTHTPFDNALAQPLYAATRAMWSLLADFAPCSSDMRASSTSSRSSGLRSCNTPQYHTMIALQAGTLTLTPARSASNLRHVQGSQGSDKETSASRSQIITETRACAPGRHEHRASMSHGRRNCEHWVQTGQHRTVHQHLAHPERRK